LFIDKNKRFYFIYSEGDCVSFRDIDFANCAGKRTCFVQYTSRVLECTSEMSNYLQIDYDCVPDFYTKLSMCGQTFYQRKGLIGSPNYPNFDANLNCKAKIIVKNDMIIKAYIKDLGIDEEFEII
jgi:hypothetical protein